MKSSTLPLFLNVVPMLPGRICEITDDAAAMAEQGIINACAFMMTLTPEGEPMTDKAASLAQTYREFEAALRAKSSVSCGILIQATIGHGWTPDTPSTGQKFVLASGDIPYIFCPLGGEFRTYLEKSVRTLAALHPDFFMLDDDFRMLTCRGGCFCPLHIDGFNRKTNSSFTKESLLTALEHDFALRESWDAWQKESLNDTAKIIRRAIDAEAPDTRCSYCMCASDLRHATDIARTLAGNSPLTVRINNGRYMNDAVRTIPDWTRHTAFQILALPPETQLLCEPDTCPQNRYSTSAATVHFHIATSILLGCRGAKLWLTRLQSYEPESGRAYREILARNNGFYRTLCSMDFQPDGILSPLPAPPPVNFPNGGCGNWATRVFGVMGFPFFYGKADAGTLAALTAMDCECLSDAEINQLLSHNLLLDGSAARVLTKRGFSQKMGFSARAWDLAEPSFEQRPGGEKIPLGSWANPVVLSPVPGRDVRIFSEIRHPKCNLFEESDVLAPGTILSVLPAGNRIAVTAVSVVPYGFGSFALLNETRKAMLSELLGPLPAYFRGDAECMMFSGRISSGDRVVFLLPLSPDGLESPVIHFADLPTKIERLSPTGTWENIPFTSRGSDVTLSLSIPCLSPAVFRLRKNAE